MTLHRKKQRLDSNQQSITQVVRLTSYRIAGAARIDQWLVPESAETPKIGGIPIIYFLLP
jgi:hypothetical protein